MIRTHGLLGKDMITTEDISETHLESCLQVDVDLRLDPEAHTVNVAAEVECVGQTGVEMEALTAVSVAALAVYDMCKASSHEIVIDNLHLELKSGGQRGYYRASTPTTNINQRVGGGPTMQ